MPARVKKSSANRLNIQFEILRTILAVVIALAIVAVIVLIVSSEPMEAIKGLLLGPLSGKRRIANVFELMIPLTFTGLAITVVFQTKRYNLASESAFYIGSMTALLIGLKSPFPPLLTIVLAFAAALVVAGIVGFIPAIANQKTGASELVISLMLNYVVSYFVSYIFKHRVRDPHKTTLQSLPLDKSLKLTNILEGTRLHSGLFIVLILAFLTWYFMYKTRWGYALRATGSNENFGKYSGINVVLVIILAQVIGTAFAGLGGAVEMYGMHTTFRWTDSPGYGWDGVIMATLARGNPAFVPFAAFFLAYVRVGADILNRTSSLPAEIVSIIQAIIILLIAAQSFLARTKHKVLVRQTRHLEGVKK